MPVALKMSKHAARSLESRAASLSHFRGQVARHFHAHADFANLRSRPCHVVVPFFRASRTPGPHSGPEPRAEGNRITLDENPSIRLRPRKAPLWAIEAGARGGEQDKALVRRPRAPPIDRAMTSPPLAVALAEGRAVHFEDHPFAVSRPDRCLQPPINERRRRNLRFHLGVRGETLVIWRQMTGRIRH